ncbi:MAG TPA: hypothetical protein VGR70_09925 [Stellaceae bacterium]|nr:hypothetical protein [Stellaceae bacterium]
MSDPTGRPHIIDPRVGSTFVSARFADMRCDGGMGGCKLSVARAPQIVVSPKPWIAGLSPQPIKVMTTLHFCELHKGSVTIEALLHDKIKAGIEARAKAKWPHEYKPDFEGAFINWILVTTPEYRKFLSKLELNVQFQRGVNVL